MKYLFDLTEEEIKKASTRKKKEIERKVQKESEEKAKREAESICNEMELDEILETYFRNSKSEKEAEEKAKKEAEQRAKKEAEEKAKKETEQRAKKESEEKAKREEMLISQNIKLSNANDENDVLDIIEELIPYNQYSNVSKHLTYLKSECNKLIENRKKYYVANDNKKALEKKLEEIPQARDTTNIVLDFGFNFAHIGIVLGIIMGIIALILNLNEGLMILAILSGILGAIICSILGVLGCGLVGLIVGCIAYLVISAINASNQNKRKSLNNDKNAQIKFMEAMDDEYEKTLANLRAYHMD